MLWQNFENKNPPPIPTFIVGILEITLGTPAMEPTIEFMHHVQILFAQPMRGRRALSDVHCN